MQGVRITPALFVEGYKIGCAGEAEPNSSSQLSLLFMIIFGVTAMSYAISLRFLFDCGNA